MATIPSKPSVGEQTKKSWADAVVDALGDHETRIGVIEAQVLPNGSFETSDGAGGAEGWTFSLTGTATAALTSTARHGKQALELAVLASGDQAQATSDHYIPCAPGERIDVGLDLKASAAGVSVTVELLWYYWTGSAWAAASTPSSTVYSSTSNPTSWARRAGQAVAPSGTNPAQAYRVRVTVAEAGGVTGTVTVDGVRAGVYRGKVARARSTAGTISTTGTYTYTVAAGDEHPRAVDVFPDDQSVNTLYDYTVQQWDGSAWVEAPSLHQVRLDPEARFRVVVSTAGDGALVVSTGSYWV
ncbi:hypothetical protein [Deferrisoma camini]|uniref:hypothetical protein n=1 Tax=Deferrisoma camini TaxID=1035120 RepID=UPI00046D9580|nr:hypothetical protein [Deferrisoma camini]